MRKNIFIINSHGFSLLEITIVLIIISILLSAVIPVLSRSYLEKAANKTAMDISAIEDASRAYYIKNNAWPSSIAPVANQIPPLDLESNGYLPSGWSATNTFVNYEPDLTDFNYHISTSINPGSLTVYTNVPIVAQPIIQNLLPTTTVDPPGNGHNVYSSVPVPGASTQTQYYDSGWFYLNYSSAVTLTHNLNTTNFTYTIWCSNSSDGSSPYTLLQSSYGATRGIVITNVTSTTLTVVSSIPSGGQPFWTLNGNSGQAGLGIGLWSVYCRVILTVIP